MTEEVVTEAEFAGEDAHGLALEDALAGDAGVDGRGKGREAVGWRVGGGGRGGAQELVGVLDDVDELGRLDAADEGAEAVTERAGATAGEVGDFAECGTSGIDGVDEGAVVEGEVDGAAGEDFSGIAAKSATEVDIVFGKW